MAKRSLLTHAIIETSFILACLTSLMYLIGITYYDSYFREWGLEETLFPLKFETVLTKGFEVIFPVAWRSSFFTVIIIMCILLFKTCLRHLDKFKWYSKPKQQLLNLIPLDTTVNHANSLTRVEQFMQQLLNRTGAVAVISLIVASLILIADKRGKEAVTNLRTGRKPFLINEIITKKQPYFVKGYIIQCSDLICAICADDEIVMINRLDIEQIRIARDIYD